MTDTAQQPQQQQQQQAPDAAVLPPPSAANGGGSISSSKGRSSGCPPHVLEAIYGKQKDKTAAYEKSLHRWWTEYADRKNDEEEEYVSNSLLYDRNHLPRTAPAPECVQRAREAAAAEAAAAQAASAAPAGTTAAAAAATPLAAS